MVGLNLPLHGSSMSKWPRLRLDCSSRAKPKAAVVQASAGAGVMAKAATSMCSPSRPRVLSVQMSPTGLRGNEDDDVPSVFTYPFTTKAVILLSKHAVVVAPSSATTTGISVTQHWRSAELSNERHAGLVRSQSSIASAPVETPVLGPPSPPATRVPCGCHAGLQALESGPSFASGERLHRTGPHTFPGTWSS